AVFRSSGGVSVLTGAGICFSVYVGQEWERMEPIDYAGALRRSWRLLVVLALVGLVIAVLAPVSHAAKTHSGSGWQASMVVGSAPTGAGNRVSGSVSSAQIQFYATTQPVERNTINAAGLNVPP